MPAHLLREIDILKKYILELGTLVEENLRRAVLAVERLDPKLARQAVELDVQIDQKEVDIEEECLKALALYQPVAHDLRFIVGVLKLNNDLERIGDLAVNIAERAELLCKEASPHTPYGFEVMADKVQAMLRLTLDAFVEMDVVRARRVCDSDDEIDAMNRANYLLVKNGLAAGSEADAMINLLAVSRNLERVADHATNIAEDVVYMVEGDIVRHKASLSR